MTFVLVVTTFATVTTRDGTPEMGLMGHCFRIFGVLLSFQLGHTTTAEVAVRGITRSLFVIDSLTVEEWGCTCFRFNLIHGTQVTPPFSTTLFGVSGVFGPFPFSTFGGRPTTTTQVFFEEFLHLGVILPLKGQLDQQVHKVVVRVGPTLPLRGSAAIVRRTCRDLTHEPQVGFCGSVGTRDTPGRSGREFREHSELLKLCAYTEISFIDRESFLRSLENLSPGRTGFYNLLHLFLQKFLLT